MFQMKKIAAGLGAAMVLAHAGTALAAPTPGAFAESMLDVNNFTFRVGNNALGASGTLINFVSGAPSGAADLGILQVNSNGSTTSIINPGNTSNTASINNAGVGTDFDLRSYVGAGAVAAVGPLAPFFLPPAETTGKVGPEFGLGGNIPGTPNTDTFATTYAGGASISEGNALTNHDNVIVHSITGIADSGLQGTNNSDQGLKSTSFLISVGSGGNPGTHLSGGVLRLEVAFDAQGWMENLLTAAGATDTNMSWNLNVVDELSGDTIFNWSPNGGVLGSSVSGTCVPATCTEYADAFTMNTSASNFPFPILTGPKTFSHSGNFESELDLAAGGLYTLTLTHKTGAHAQLDAAVPEPTTLALLGLGLLGVGVQRRRSKAA